MKQSKIRVGILFSKDLVGNEPLAHIGPKLPVYLRLLDLMGQEGWQVYLLTKKTYVGGGVFDGVWHYRQGKFEIVSEKVKMDLVYDRSGGVTFPPENDTLKVINDRRFKILAWDKYHTYEEIGEFMPKTVWLEDLAQIKSDWIVVKPFNGLEGKGIYIGPREHLEKTNLLPGKKYIVQEFVDTSHGIPGVVSGNHDLRVVVVNGQVVWCHVRTPAPGSLLANRAQGGTLTEVDYQEVLLSVKKVVEIVSRKFMEKYDNPVFSIDFGVNEKGTPLIFEINDQIGFPTWEMKKRDTFLAALIENFKTKLPLHQKST